VRTEFWTESLESLRRPTRRRRSEDNIKVCLKVVRCEAVDWIRVSQSRGQRRALVYLVVDVRIALNGLDDRILSTREDRPMLFGYTANKIE
jgi:hypothetical protein